MMSIDLYGRPDDYYQTLAAKYRTQTTAMLDEAARGVLIEARGGLRAILGGQRLIDSQACNLIWNI